MNHTIQCLVNSFILGKIIKTKFSVPVYLSIPGSPTGGVEFNVIPGLTTLVRQALYSAVRRQLNTGHLIVSSRRQRLACVVQQKEVTNCSPLCTRRGINPSSGYYWTP